MSKVYVIAEAGSCHANSLKWALELVDMAKQVGADAVKFQFWSSPDELADRRGGHPALRSAYREFALVRSWLGPLRSLAQDRDLDFMCTAFLPQDVPVVSPFVDAFKVSSFEAEAEDLLSAVGEAMAQDVVSVRPAYVSLGMGASRQVASRVLGNAAGRVRFLHCVSAYPAPQGELNLGRIRADGLDGFSDHSGRRETGALAVASGARFLEAHLRLDCTPSTNPDYPHALPPEAFAAYVAAARSAASALGDGESSVMPSERGSLQYKVVGAEAGEAGSGGGEAETL